MELVTTRDQVVENLRVFHGYRSDPDDRVRADYGELLRRGRKFVVRRIGDDYAFAPSRFVGYQGVTLRRHQEYTGKHGTRTTSAINSILGRHRPNLAIETEYNDSCVAFGVTPYDIDNRAFWILDDADATASSEALEAEQLVRARGVSGTGQGFGLSTSERRIVEGHAMGLAIRYFGRDWGSVQDVSATRSYDLLCSRYKEQLRVEVKGTTTYGSEIVLTRNEVIESGTSGYALFVVSEIVLDRSGEHTAAHGGVARLFHPWSAEPDALRPISYQCSIDHSDGRVIEGLADSD